ncbi:hypothetical protein L1987_71367 [Smallanthus sonchifolius]|uniref:Uncharacterized protein n=1 Tax=Smallanthus sonchifolius TaxID=185202 RepID=A0ACB9ASW6_9ASTR|nr:hypothetical protein L1987_71367 [Smallanthus sonchifolius]
MTSARVLPLLSSVQRLLLHFLVRFEQKQAAKTPDFGRRNKKSSEMQFLFFVSKSGITRHKHHLAWDSPNVSRCPKVPNEVKALFKEHFEKKKRSREMMNSIPHFDDVVDLDEDELEINHSEAKSKGKKSPGSTTDAFNKKAKGTLL